jgi:DNA-binding response OmpR family regulator
MTSLDSQMSASAREPEVLVIEDDLDTRALLEDALRQSGFAVTVASSGLSGLAALRARVPDIVLLDQGLPGLNGIEVCRQIRREPGLFAVPVVILTAMSRTTDQVAGLQAGADDYLTKPFQVDELAARLHSHIRRSRRERQLNPLTGLPGNLAIDAAIEGHLESGLPFAVAWIDLDNFKVYNDRYGFYAGDQVLEATGRVLIRTLEKLTLERVFAGHIGGDDFVLIVPLEKAEDAGRLIVEEFDQLVPGYYTPEDIGRGFVPAVSRTGEERAFPLMSISVAIVPCFPGRFSHPAEIAHVASEIKHHLKQQPGSVWLVDRRAIAGEAFGDWKPNTRAARDSDVGDNGGETTERGDPDERQRAEPGEHNQSPTSPERARP